MTNSDRLGQIGSAALLLSCTRPQPVCGCFSPPLLDGSLSFLAGLAWANLSHGPVTTPLHLDLFHVHPVPTFMCPLLPYEKRPGRESSFMSFPKSCLLWALHFAWPWTVARLRVSARRWVHNSGTSLYHFPRGKSSRRLLASPSPLALDPWPCGHRLPGDAGRGLCSLPQFSLFFFQGKCLVRSRLIPKRRRLPEGDMGGGHLHLCGHSSQSDLKSSSDGAGRSIHDRSYLLNP